jgi:hypothetical protein
MVTGDTVLNHSTPKMISHFPISMENMLFFREHTHLKFHIFTLATTFHRFPIRNHNFKVVNNMDITMCFLGNVVMNVIVGVATVN